MYSFQKEQRIREAIDILTFSVKATLGPTGKTTVIDTTKGILCVDDGATIIRQLNFANQTKNQVLELVRQASLKTDEIVGDGTTTTILLTCSFLKESLRFISSGIQSIHLIVGLKKITNFLLYKIRNFSIPITTKKQIDSLLELSMGSFSKNIKEDVFKALKKKGKYGSIVISEDPTHNPDCTTVELVDGFQLDKGCISPYFLDSVENSSVILHRPYTLITDLTLTSIDQIREILEDVKKTRQSLFIIAGGYEKSLLSTLIINSLNDNIKVVPIKAPFFGLKQKQVLEDLALVTTSRLILSKFDSDNYVFQKSDLGRAKFVKSSNRNTTITLLSSSRINVKRRIDSLERELVVNDGVYEKDILKQRINLLSGSIVKVLVSGSTDSEIKHIRLKVEDGINSLQTSFQEGVIISSSNFLLHILELLQFWATINLSGDEVFSLFVFRKAFLYPFFQLCSNTNVSYALTLDSILEKGYPYGFNFKSLRLINLKEEFLYDSSKMMRIILQNSISVSSSLLLSF